MLNNLYLAARDDDLAGVKMYQCRQLRIRLYHQS